jgi:3-hydroxyacyl-[acyl-carrier-protein] dehydratase
MKGILLHDFFEIISQEETENKLNTIIKLKANHRIFEGHFPNRPIVPGVCILQMVKEILMKKTQHNLRMTESSNIKFINIVDPRENDIIMIALNYNHGSALLNISVIVNADAVVFCKFQASYCLI